MIGGNEQASGLRLALLCAFSRRSPPADLEASLHLCAPVLWCLGVVTGAGGLPRHLDFRSVCSRGGVPALASVGAVLCLHIGPILVACAVA